MTTYLSLFSGAGGFEHPDIPPVLVCESDPACARVLRRRIPEAPLHTDVRALKEAAPSAEFVVGGWPCQDISSAGNTLGLDGDRSGLFFDMLETAKRAKAHTVVGENVPNLLSVNKGRDFERLLAAFSGAGYPFVSWRTLNARQFGLPQERNRVFIVASQHRELALALHASQPNPNPQAVHCNPQSAGFYWTAGGRSICYGVGYTPALKIGASDGKGRSVVATFRNGIVKKVSAIACARLQGFESLDFEGETKTDIVRMAGNAVPVPMGEFVLRNVFAGTVGTVRFCGTGAQIEYSKFPEAGLYEDRTVWETANWTCALATNLDDFVAADDGESLSGQAAAGLIVRTVRSGKLLPTELFDALLRLSHERSSYRGSRSNSFDELDQIDIEKYRRAQALGSMGGLQIENMEERQQDLFAD